MKKQFSQKKTQKSTITPKTEYLKKAIPKIGISVIAGVILHSIIPQDSKTVLTQANDISFIRQQIENRLQHDFLTVDPNNANSYYYQGINFYNESNYEKAIERFKKAIDDQIKIGNLNDLDSARYYYTTGNAYFYLMDYTNAIIQYSNALGILELLKLRKEETPLSNNETCIVSKENPEEITIDNEISYVHYLKCISYLKCKDYERAFENLKAIGIDAHIGANKIISISDVQNLKGDFLHAYAYEFENKERVNYFYEAIRAYNVAFNSCFLHSREKGYKQLTENEATIRRKEHAPVVHFHLLYPQITFSTKNSDLLESPIDGYPIEILTRKKSIAIALTNRSKMYLEFGQIDNCIEDSKAALIIYQDLSLVENKDICDTYYNLMYAYLLKGDIKTSQEYMKLVIDKQKKWFGDKSVQTAIAYENISILYLNDENKNYDTAINYLTEAKKIFELHHMEEDVKKTEYLIESIQSVIKDNGIFNFNIRKS